MEKYVVPEMEIIVFDNEDVITTSAGRSLEPNELPEIEIKG